ncbi:MAG: amidase [Castellaniella sp.]
MALSELAILPDIPDIATLVRQYHRNERNPLDFVQTLLQRIETANTRLRAYITVFEDEALERAQAAGERYRRQAALGPLDGIPLAIKDILPTVNGPTTAGSRILQDYRPGYDAPIVGRLRQAGAIILGKNNLHEYAFGVTSDNQCFGRVINPVHPALLPGGSSGGTAAAVAAGLAVAGVGSDTGGSIRIPAACCELVGLKPTYGRVDASTAIPQAWSLDHLGPITRNVADARQLLSVLTLTGACDADMSANPRADEPLRIGVDPSGLALCSPAVRDAFERVLTQLRTNGHQLSEFRHPDWQAGFRAWLVIMLSESASYHAENLQLRARDIDAGVLPFLIAGSRISATHYLDAQRYRRLWTRDLHQRTQAFDLVLNPAFPSAVPQQDTHDILTGRGLEPVRNALVEFQWPANLTGWPSITLPTPLRVADGPFSIMLTHPGCDDFLLLDMAERLERQTLALLA